MYDAKLVMKKERMKKEKGLQLDIPEGINSFFSLVGLISFLTELDRTNRICPWLYLIYKWMNMKTNKPRTEIAMCQWEKIL